LTTATPRQCDKSTAGGNQTRQSRPDYRCRYGRFEVGEGAGCGSASLADVRREGVA
jgi:hypothetical protein